MATAWFNRRAGEHGRAPSAAVAKREGPMVEGGMVVFGDLRVPSRVRLPEAAGFGTDERRVLSHGWQGCPKHEPERWTEPGRVLVFEVEPGGIFVAECPACGFSVFTLESR
jgi:hypothetical protein